MAISHAEASAVRLLVVQQALRTFTNTHTHTPSIQAPRMKMPAKADGHGLCRGWSAGRSALESHTGTAMPSSSMKCVMKMGPESRPSTNDDIKELMR